MAVDKLREEYPQIPIIGVEPGGQAGGRGIPPRNRPGHGHAGLPGGSALCGAAAAAAGGARVVPVPCGGLMEFVERGEMEGPALTSYLQEKLSPYEGEKVDAVVLGCTHYPFLRHAIREALPTGTALIDGNAGITAQLRRRLSELGLSEPGAGTGPRRLL